MPARFLLRLALATLFAAVVAGSGVACTQRQDLAGDTVRVRWSDRRADLEVISCGLDDEAFVLAAESASGFVQLLLVVGEPGDDGERDIDIDRSAVTAEVDVGVLGAGDAGLLGVSAGEPGRITRASIRGDRVDIDADARVLGDPGGASVELEIDARCPAVEEIASGDFVDRHRDTGQWGRDQHRTG